MIISDHNVIPLTTDAIIRKKTKLARKPSYRRQPHVVHDASAVYLKIIGKGFVPFKINSSPSAFCKSEGLFMFWIQCRMMTSSQGRIKTSSWFVSRSALNLIFGTLSAQLSLIIMSSDKNDSLGLFTAGLKPPRAYNMSLWHQNVRSVKIYTVSGRKRPPKENAVTCTIYNTIR